MALKTTSFIFAMFVHLSFAIPLEPHQNDLEDNSILRRNEILAVPFDYQDRVLEDSHIERSEVQAVPLEPHQDYALEGKRILRGDVSAVPLDSWNHDQHQDGRIVGGEDAAVGAARHMVALVFGYSIISLTCGGSIISTRVVLSAAHCITPFVNANGVLMETLAGVVGSNQWNSRDNLVRFQSHINHPQWDSRFIKHDVGVLFLRERLHISDLVDIIPLNYDWVDGGVESYATGWGRIGVWGPIADNLQMLHVRTTSGQQCIDGILQATQQWGWAPPVNPNVEICTYHSVDHGMCNGDSGSALVEKSSGKQIGIVSWGFPCARGAPDVFGRISGFRNFLEQMIRIHA